MREKKERKNKVWVGLACLITLNLFHYFFNIRRLFMSKRRSHLQINHKWWTTKRFRRVHSIWQRWFSPAWRRRLASLRESGRPGRCATSTSVASRRRWPSRCPGERTEERRTDDSSCPVEKVAVTKTFNLFKTCPSSNQRPQKLITTLREWSLVMSILFLKASCKVQMPEKSSLVKPMGSWTWRCLIEDAIDA